MKVKFVYVKGENARQQSGKIAAWITEKNDKPAGIMECGGTPENPTCLGITDWIEVSDTQFGEITKEGLWTVDIKTKLLTRIDDIERRALYITSLEVE